jgi:RNA polymerase sigma-70 factor (ECF subfamily)
LSAPGGISAIIFCAWRQPCRNSPAGGVFRRDRHFPLSGDELAVEAPEQNLIQKHKKIDALCHKGSAVVDTPLSLLDRLRLRPDEESWQRFDRLYRPLILRWLHRDPTLREDADDLAQEVLSVVYRGLPAFEHQQRVGSFRNWLRTIMDNRVKNHRRKHQNRPQALGLEPNEGPLAQLADDDSELSLRWDREHNEHVVGQLLKLIAGEFNDVHVRAFHRYALEGASADEVAGELGVSTHVVLHAKSRILHRLRELGRGLLD